jgi:two-component system, chemotaxis family, response regulator PixG
MDTLPIADQRTYLRLHPLSLLSQVRSRNLTGCLSIHSGPDSWLLYLEEGELVFASSSRDPFERLDRHLRQLSRQVPSLVSAIRVQVRLLFESRQPSSNRVCPDFQAVQWLLEQQYLTMIQASMLIENLAREILGSLLSVSTGNYDTVDAGQFETWTTVCRLDLKSLVEQCQQQASARTDGTTGATVVSMLQRSGGSSVAEPAIAASTASPATTVGKPPQDANGKRTRTDGYRIVCIDDSPTILKLIDSYLQDESFNVLMIGDPVRALMQVVRHKPDLILLDVEMPNLDGYEFCSLLRRHPAFKATPIVMVTSNNGFLDRARAKLAGSSGYLTKPFAQSELLKIVFKHLPQHHLDF